MESKDLCLVVLFQQQAISSCNMAVYVPSNPMIGNITEDNIFIDALTGEKYLNVDQIIAMNLPEGYDCVLPLKKFRDKSLRISWDKVRKAWLNLELQIEFFNTVTNRIVTMSQSEFEEQFKVKFDIIHTKKYNELTDALIMGKISSKDYFNDVYVGSSFQDEEEVEEENEEEKINLPPIDEAYESIRKRVVAQDEAIKKILVQIYKNISFNNSSMKSNILLCGPTGVGKTETVKSIAKTLNIPLSVEDMTRYTETGYKGSNVDDIILNLINKADGDLELAQRSILFLDEIDKKASTEKVTLDFNKSDVLKSLLKIVEGGEFNIHLSDNRIIQFDTSNLIVIAAGAFSDLFDKSTHKNAIGFNSVSSNELKNTIEIEDLKNYGVPIEFLGRFRSIVRLNPLSEENIVDILKNSEISVMRNYIEAFKEKGIHLNVPESIYHNIAKLAIKNETGARGLNLVVDDIFESSLYEILKEMDNIESITLGENILENKEEFVLKRKMG